MTRPSHEAEPSHGALLDMYNRADARRCAAEVVGLKRAAKAARKEADEYRDEILRRMSEADPEWGLVVRKKLAIARGMLTDLLQFSSAEIRKLIEKALEESADPWSPHPHRVLRRRGRKKGRGK